MVGVDSTKLPTPPPSIPVFPVKAQSVIVGEEPKRLAIPPVPPLPPLLVNVQLVIVGEEENILDIPPPLLLEKAQLTTVGEDK